MSEFYRVNMHNFYNNNFAYCEPTDDASYSHPTPKCPVCGSTVGPLQWDEPRKVIFSKPKYGDLVYGLKFLVSEKFKNLYENSDLKGIIEFIPVEIVKVRYLKQLSTEIPIYYSVRLIYSFARVDKNRSYITGHPDERYCSLCKPFGTTIDVIKGIYIDETNWGGEDIFHLHEIGSIFISQKFVDFCLINELTNLDYINTKNYVM